MPAVQRQTVFQRLGLPNELLLQKFQRWGNDGGELEVEWQEWNGEQKQTDLNLSICTHRTVTLYKSLEADSGTRNVPVPSVSLGLGMISIQNLDAGSLLVGSGLLIWAANFPEASRMIYSISEVQRKLHTDIGRYARLVSSWKTPFYRLLRSHIWRLI